MIILGIDPGYATIGYGVIEKNGSKLTAIDYGVISTPKDESIAYRLFFVTYFVQIGNYDTKLSVQLYILAIHFGVFINEKIDIIIYLGNVIAFKAFAKGFIFKFVRCQHPTLPPLNQMNVLAVGIKMFITRIMSIVTVYEKSIGED